MSTCSYLSTTTNILRLSGFCLGLPGWAGTRKVKPKPIWIYWSKRQWVAVASAGPYASLHLAQTDNHASIQPLSFYRPDALPGTQPTESKHWRHIAGVYHRAKSGWNWCSSFSCYTILLLLLNTHNASHDLLCESATWYYSEKFYKHSYGWF